MMHGELRFKSTLENSQDACLYEDDTSKVYYAKFDASASKEFDEACKFMEKHGRAPMPELLTIDSTFRKCYMIT